MKFLLIAFLVCLSFAVAILFFGSVTGVEFCPQKFITRRFNYYQIPFARIQLTPVIFGQSSQGNAALATHLQSNKLLGATSSKLRWDVVHMTEIGLPSNRGDADVLMKYLEQPGALGAENWLDWTQNKERAPIVSLFWPLIAKMAEEQLYILMPDVFDMARAAKSPEEFSRRVRTEVPAAVRQLAEAERYRKNSDRAAHLDSMALEIMELQPVEVPESSFVEIETKSITAEADPEGSDIEMAVDVE